MKRLLLSIALIFFLSTNVSAQNNKIKQLVNNDANRLIGVFKDLHKNPELAFMEVRTSGIIEKELKALGFKTITGIAKTGLVGVLENGDGPVVMFRADMDCNSVKEITNLPYASDKTMKNSDGIEVPVMHACGHDAHVTWLIGIAKTMVSLKKNWSGTLLLLAQPAEEPLTGAKAMVNDKMYTEKGVPVPDRLLGLHTWPIPVGKVKSGFGARGAGSDQLDVTFYGIGGHGSKPESTIDPILMACNAVLQYQTIISRNIGAQDAAVLHVGAINAGFENNVVPPSATVKINLRWFSEETRQIMLDKIQLINEGIALANGISNENYPTINLKSTVPALKNDISTVRIINAALLNNLMDEEDLITDTPAIMGSEDFSHLIIDDRKTKSAFLFIGTANPKVYEKAVESGKEFPFYNHNGNYIVDLSSIPVGVEVGSAALISLFNEKNR